MQPLLDIQNLSIDFTTENEKISAVENLSLQIKRGEIVALVGESGSGKSVTALSLLQLLPTPPAIYAGGKILFSDSGVSHLDLISLVNKKRTSTSNSKIASINNPEIKEISDLRGSQIAMIFQEPMTSLNPVMKCGKQIAEALVRHKRISRAEAKKETLKWFEKVDIPDPEKTFHKYPHQISGGQKQRVMIAMAMCCQPALLICDEPTTALDVTVQKKILLLIKQLQQEQNMGVLLITHDLGIVAEIADRVAIMFKGVILEQNSTIEIFRHPQHPYTKALIACRPALHAKGERLPVVDDFLQPGQNPAVAATSSPPMIPHLNEVLVKVENLSVRFPVKRNLLGKATHYFTAVDNTSFEIYRGETLGLVGESGCGKTTLGRALLRLIEPSGGDILFQGSSITQTPESNLQHFRKEVQLVFQDPFSSLNPRLTIGEALAEPMRLFSDETKTQRRSSISKLLEQVQLSPKFASRYPHEFSGGQRQRIVIARALALNPTFLVCDESVSALDVSVQAQILNLLNNLKSELGLTMLFISHDLSVIRYMSDRLMVMKAGKIVERGDSEEIYRNPKHDYTKQLLSAIPKIKL
ncbi:ABC transporter ATP-binding protein [Chitinophagaceae bacterium LB-8]|uniref:ABC transporter ATP-binding protein n=1 Tax=Paraflavisolibacter caeni TaxID=2982496 RepID=A0A9X2XV08_9BACT|nr:ABC transporter ATP-binding protein [Paraflavisolibacter caeni]MCU7549046.1 ABC transporter ATP-binding protein [Paraflavisolibacter caeni]